MTDIEQVDVVICGSGPAGSMASAFLAKKQIHHLVLEKAAFPRDKICGDALSGKVTSVLRKLDPELLNQLASDSERFLPSHGIRFASPDGNYADIPFRISETGNEFPPGFLSKRIDFDAFLAALPDRKFARLQTNTTLAAIQTDSEGLLLEVKSETATKRIRARLLIAADGARSLAAKQLAHHTMEPEHHCAGIRAYYKNVGELHSRNFIELHFLPSMLPGYLWIFPLPDGTANVGAGILTEVVSRHRINLRQRFEQALREEPTLKDRFAHAERIGPVAGWGLPLGSKKRKLSGDHFLLTGDAASLIDPFTGEGISNAMYSGMVAADTAEAALASGDFSAAGLARYDQAIYNRMGSEFRISHTLQKLCKYPWLFNRVIRKASKNAEFRNTITCMFEDMDIRSRLTSPGFYFRMLFGNTTA